MYNNNNKILSTIIVIVLVVLVVMIHKCETKGEEYYQNSVLAGKNSPDPGVLLYNNVYYVVTTSNLNTESSKFPIHTSKDLVNWEMAGYVFPGDGAHLPKWANQDFWAPELHVINGQFRVYFTARDSSSGVLCIGVGTSDHGVTGPYRDIGHPLVKNMTVGSIDATVMKLESDYYLVWKDDGNDPKYHLPTWIWARQLTSDGLQFATDSKYPLIRNTLEWEGDLVEAPWVIHHNSTYFLFYSANGYCDARYTIGVARSKYPLGPYEKRSQPIVHSNSVWIGPGHCSVVQKSSDLSSYVIMYHSWYKNQVCGDNNRLLMLDELLWDSQGWPYIQSYSPSVDPQPYPLQ